MGLSGNPVMASEPKVWDFSSCDVTRGSIILGRAIHLKMKKYLGVWNISSPLLIFVWSQQLKGILAAASITPPNPLCQYPISPSCLNVSWMCPAHVQSGLVSEVRLPQMCLFKMIRQKPRKLQVKLFFKICVQTLFNFVLHFLNVFF